MIKRNTDTKFKVVSNWPPAGDQPQAILDLVKGFESGQKKQTLLGVTGSGKTFTVANVVEKLNKTTLVIAHNKTLAAQLAQEFKEFFPNNKVHYFVSYYDYYQPEAYVSATDTYIEKDASINEEIDRLRHASTQNVLTRADTLIVASVSCIYGLGSPEDYKKENLILSLGDSFTKFSLMEKLVSIHFERTNADLKSGTFRAIGNRVDIMPVSETWMASVFFSGGTISMIQILNPVSMTILEETDNVMFFPAKHFITDDRTMSRAILEIQKEMEQQVKMFEKQGKLLEADRIKRRTMQDVAMMREVGYCSGIENYSRPLSGKKPGEAPETLLSYFPHDHKGNPEFLTVIDESHVTLPQLHGMYAGDQARKTNLVNYGFRLPSALDNRPLKYEEFEKRVGQILYVSATPGKMEIEESEQIVQQIIRPTGLIDPVLEIRPVLPEGEKKIVKKYFVFDFDGVIGNTYQRVIEARAMFEETTFEKAKILLDEYFDNKTNHAKDVTLDTIEHFRKLIDFTADFLVETGFRLFNEFVDEIKKISNARIAIVSSGSAKYVLPALKKSKLKYSHVLCYEDHHSKEEKLLTIVKAWKIDVKDIIYVTDTKTDVYELENLLGKENILGCAWGFQGKEKLLEVLPPENILEAFSDLNKFIDKRFSIQKNNKEKSEEKKYPGQIEDFIAEVEKEVKGGGQVLTTTLTKKMAEDLTNFLKERKIKAEYIHSDIKTIERIQILTEFRRKTFHVLVGVNLLREGLDLPEVSLIGILDADKEGFLRSETSLIQTIGRAARNVNGRVILYADSITGSMERAMGETERRRKVQEDYNKEHGITPKTILKSISDITSGMEHIIKKTAHSEAMLEMKLSGKKVSTLLKQKEKEMRQAAKELDFETAAILRDEIEELTKMLEKEKSREDKETLKT